MKFATTFLGAAAFIGASTVGATELEVTHWWTSGGEAAAVAELAKAFDATGNKLMALSQALGAPPGPSWSAASRGATRWPQPSSTTAVRPRNWSKRV